MFEASVVSVHIPPAFRGYVGGHDEVLVSAETVGELLEAVGHEYPSFIAKAMSADGGLAPGLQLFFGAHTITDTPGLAIPVALEEILSIVPLAQG